MENPSGFPPLPHGKTPIAVHPGIHWTAGARPPTPKESEELGISDDVHMLVLKLGDGTEQVFRGDKYCLVLAPEQEAPEQEAT